MVEELLPEDIVFQILLWLPVVSLLRFKSVCKSWYSLIESCQFVSQHKYKGSEESNNNVIVMNRNRSPLFSLLYGNTQFQLFEDFKDYLYIEGRVGQKIRYGNIISCDGILCIQHCDWDISLWNPATRQFRILPKSYLMDLVLEEEIWGHFIFHGFGFDDITNDYKVVRFNINQAEVYSLLTNSWKCLDYNVFPVDTICSYPRTPYLNGIYCWMGKLALNIVPENGNEIFRIITFDFTSEVFGTIPLPNIYIQNDYYQNLSILRDKISLIFSPEFGREIDFYQIWVLDEYGVKESWAKLYTVGPFPMCRSIGFSIKGDLFVEKDTQLYLCDLVTNELKNLPVVEGTKRPDFQVAVYKESLVSF